MTLRINSKEVALGLVAMPAMNFGQSHRYEGQERVQYQFLVTEKLAIQCLTPWWDELRKDLIFDQGASERGDFPELDELHDVRYPDLRDMIYYHQELLEKVILWGAQEVLQAIERPSKSPKFVIDSLDSVDLTGGEACFLGRAFRVNR